MTNDNKTQLLVVVDRSGSMYSCAEDMRGGLNEFFNAQSELDGECVVDYVQFDSNYELVYTDKPVDQAEAVLEPRGATALLDAIGKSVTDLGNKLRAQKEADRPGTVIVAVITDGYENASTEWSPETVKELIKNQTDKYNWNFTFLGANLDAVAVGASFGFSKDTSLTFNTKNTRASTDSLIAYASNTRSGLANAYTDEDRKSNA